MHRLSFLLIVSLSLYASASCADSLSRDYLLQKVNIIVASGYSGSLQKEDDFFRYYPLSGSNYLRVAHEYYGVLVRGKKIQLDELSETFLSREMTDRDWFIIFIGSDSKELFIKGCEMFPVELYPKEVLSMGREAIIEYTASHSQFGKLCRPE